MQKTFTIKKSELDHQWWLVDATDKTLGRLAARIVTILRGKHKPEFTSHMDTGDYVVVINAEKIKVTGNKTKDKLYHSHSGYPGGIKTIAFDKLLIKAPERILEFAVKGMLPKGPLGRLVFRKLKVYAGPDHPHAAQQLQKLEIQSETK